MRTNKKKTYIEALGKYYETQNVSEIIRRYNSRKPVDYNHVFLPSDEWSAMLLSEIDKETGCNVIPHKNTPYDMYAVYKAHDKIFKATEGVYSGEVVFFDENMDGIADRAGFVLSTGERSLWVVYGENNEIQLEKMLMTDSRIMAYGRNNWYTVDTVPKDKAYEMFKDEIKKYQEAEVYEQMIEQQMYAEKALEEMAQEELKERGLN